MSKQDEETTTVDHTDMTTLQEQTTVQPEDNTSTEDLTTTTDSSETTTFENQALFFFNSDEDHGTEDTPTTTSETSSTTKTNKGLPEASHLDPLFSTQPDTDIKQTANFVRFPTDDEYPSYASRFKHEYGSLFDNNDDDDDDDFESDERKPSWRSSSQLEFKFPEHYRHSGRDYHSESYYTGGSDPAHLFRHRPKGRFR